MTFKKWLSTPKGYVFMAMAVYLVVASFLSHTMQGIEHAVLAAALAAGLDAGCCLLEKRKRIMPDGAVITGLIIALILSTTSSWFVVSATVILAILSKHLLVRRKKPIFNPAAFGLLLSIPLFHSEQSWWGAFGDLPMWTMLLLLIGGYAAANRVHKYPQVFSFLGMYLVLLLIMGVLQIGDAADALRSPFINACLFFGFFMLTDPPTSPAKPKQQVLFGLLVAIIGSTIYAFFGGLMYLYIGLLAGNLYHMVTADFAKRTSKQQQNTLRRHRTKDISM